MGGQLSEKGGVREGCPITVLYVQCSCWRVETMDKNTRLIVKYQLTELEHTLTCIV